MWYKYSWEDSPPVMCRNSPSCFHKNNQKAPPQKVPSQKEPSSKPQASINPQVIDIIKKFLNKKGVYPTKQSHLVNIIFDIILLPLDEENYNGRCRNRGYS